MQPDYILTHIQQNINTEKEQYRRRLALEFNAAPTVLNYFISEIFLRCKKNVAAPQVHQDFQNLHDKFKKNI